MDGFLFRNDARHVIAVGTVEFIGGAFLVLLLASSLYLVARFVWRMRHDEDVVVANRYSDQVTRRKEQTPEEAVAEWDRKHRKRSK